MVPDLGLWGQIFLETLGGWEHCLSVMAAAPVFPFLNHNLPQSASHTGEKSEAQQSQRPKGDMAIEAEVTRGTFGNSVSEEPSPALCGARATPDV